MRKLLVLLSAVAFVVAFTAPAMAADWGFYGNARMTTFMDDDSKEVTETDFGDDDLTWDLQGNSRFGASVKAGDIGGGFEYGTGVNLRKLYGTWNFGGGTLLLGQTYSPVNMFYSNQVWGGDADMLPYGGVYGGRNPMIQLAMGSLKIALLKPKAPGGVLTAEVPAEVAQYTDADLAELVVDEEWVLNTDYFLVWSAGGENVIYIPSTAGITEDTDTTMPKLEVSYSFKAGPVGLTVVGGYNTYDVVDTSNDKSYGIDSYIVGLGFNVGLGAAYIKGNVYTGTNLGPYGMWQEGADDPDYDADTDSIKDCDSMGYLVVGGFKVSDTISLEAGYGHTESELDVAGSKADETDAYYVQATINLAKGCFIVPEIGKVDFKEDADGEKQGETTYFGAKWQINF